MVTDLFRIFSQSEELYILRPNLSQNMNKNDFEKINIKMEISTWPSTSVPNLSQFEELQILDQICPKNMNEKNFVIIDLNSN